MRTTRPGRAWLGLVVVAVALCAASASAAPTAASLRVEILVGTGPVSEQPPIVPNGRTVPIASLNFVAGFSVINAGPDAATLKIQFELSSGLRWGADAPDPSEDCTAGETTTVCDAALGTALTNTHAEWGWNVVADSAGTYTLKVQLVESSTSDPDTADNASTVTVVVTQPAGGGSGGGAGGGSGPAAATASAVKVSPAKPKAGSNVVASVRVTRGGSPVKPTGIACSATIGQTKIKGGAKSSSGVASCLFKTPKSGRGKRMLGSVSFKASGKSFTKRFMTTLG